ncbi:MAG: hypothetical protein ACT4TC_01530 [Myxococcaceae bacterium]
MTHANGNWNISPNETRTWPALYALTRFLREMEDVILTTRTGETDAGQLSDETLIAFFAKARQQAKSLCDEARVLQAERTANGAGGRDTVEEASMESFPASDPPAH